MSMYLFASDMYPPQCATTISHYSPPNHCPILAGLACNTSRYARICILSILPFPPIPANTTPVPPDPGPQYFPNTSRILHLDIPITPLQHPSNILTTPLICPEAAVFAFLPTRVTDSPSSPYVLFFFFFSIKSYFSENNRHGCPKPENHRNQGI